MEIRAASSEIAKRIHGIIKAEAIKLAEDGIFHGERQPFGFNFALGHIHDYKFEVHSVRPVHRIGPDGKRRSDFLIQITQRRPLYFDVRRQAEEEERYRTPGEQKVAPDLWECDAKFRGGATFLLDLETFEIRYAIYKNILSERRIERQRKFMSGESGTSLAELYFGKPGAGQRFAHLHGGDDLLNADPNH